MSRQSKTDEPALPARTTKLLWFALGAIYLVVAAWTPLTLLPNIGHDDGNYIQRAQALLKGDWLGEYDQYTLMKGPGYPVFLVASAWSGLPLTIATALFRVLAVTLFAHVVARATRSDWLATSLYVVTLWNPISFTSSMLRVMRDSIYSEQLLLVIAAATGVLFVATKPRQRALWGSLCGLALGWFALTREEALWIAPGLGVLFAFGLARECGSATARIGRLLPAAAGLLLLFLLVLGSFRFGNLRAYGAFVGVDFKQPEFRAVLAALFSAGHRTAAPFLPVRRETRAELYRASPAFATLAGTLDPAAGPTWQSGCAYYRWTCGDIAGGWLAWALRDAVASQGHYESPRAAAAFYKRLAAEIELACKAGTVRCDSTWLDYVPHPTSEQWASAPTRLLDFVRWISFRQRPRLDAEASVGQSDDFARVATLLNRPLIAPATPVVIELQGDYEGAGSEWFEAVSASGGATPTIVFDRLPPRKGRWATASPSNRKRFRAVVRAGLDSSLIFRTPSGATQTAELSDLLGGERRIKLGDGELVFHQAKDLEAPARTDRRFLAVRRLRASLVELYAALMPVLLAVGAVAFVYALLRLVWRREVSVELALAGLSWTLVASRAAVLLLFDITLFPAIHPLYLSPAYHQAAIAAILSLAAVTKQWRGSGAVSLAASSVARG